MRSFFTYCQRHLLVTITLCYASGIWLSSVLPVDTRLTIFTAAAALVLSFFFWLLRMNQSAIVVLCLCFLTTGVLLANRQRSPPDDPSHISIILSKRQEAILVGTLREISIRDGQTSRVIIEVKNYRTEDMEHFRSASGLLRLTLNKEWPRTLLPGDGIALRASPRKPPVVNTPGTFNYSYHLARQDIHLVATLNSDILIQSVHSPGIEPRAFSYQIERLRTQIAYHLSDLLPPDSASLYRAILIGDRSGIAPPVLEAFKGAGVMHILAISGMHMALLGFILFKITFWVLRRSEKLILMIDVRKSALLLCLVPLLVYTMLAGAAAPVLRSFIMSLFVIFALAVNRFKSPITILSGAGLFLLVIDPLALESASFQLSFSAVAAIILITPYFFSLLYPDYQHNVMEKRYQKVLRWLWGAVSVTIGATLGTMPLLLYHFNRFSLVTIPANLIIEPLICLWGLPLGFLSLPFLFINPSVASLILQAGAPGLSLAVETASFLSGLSFSTLWLPDPPLWLIISYYLFLSLPFLFPGSTLLRKTALASVPICIVLFLLPITGIPGILRQNTRVTFIDIGHGSASLIECAGGRNILIDGGGRAAPGFDLGERILAPFLWNRGIANLDDIVITHGDADHYNGIPALLRRFHPKRLWLPSLNNEKPSYQSLCRLAERMGVELRLAGRHILQSENGPDLEVMPGFAPVSDPDIPAGRLKAGSEDDRGLVLRLKTADFSVLFPGDISRVRERQLVASGKQLESDILLSPHHGSSTSNSEVFLSAVKPKYMVVSSGDRTGMLFPTPATRKIAAGLGITVLTTVGHGTVTVSTAMNGYRLSTYQQGSSRKRQVDVFRPQ